MKKRSLLSLSMTISSFSYDIQNNQGLGKFYQLGKKMFYQLKPRVDADRIYHSMHSKRPHIGVKGFLHSGRVKIRAREKALEEGGVGENCTLEYSRYP